jgi:hypothetical protein
MFKVSKTRIIKILKAGGEINDWSIRSLQ